MSSETAPLYRIRNLRCGYAPGQPPVLVVDNLDIYRGELTFVVGVSGGGKSTLLETLGLMNRTVLGEESPIQFQGTSAPEKVDLANLWKQPSAIRGHFRKTHLSFIFQKTNLMANFTCGENAMLPALFKGIDPTEARQRVLNHMEEIGLPATIFDKHISEVSGGQRQRLAFIRALAADFTVLFGDEPTGNLDPTTARQVMQMLKAQLSSTKSAIVVSHDLALATEFADRIIPITLRRSGKVSYGEVLPKYIVTANHDGKFVDAHGNAVDVDKQLHRVIK